MSKNNRLDRIIEIVTTQGYVKNSDLTENLKVSEMTIRRDLKTLEEQGRLQRVDGWAITALNAAPLENTFSQRLYKNIEEKILIAKTASKMISKGDKIILDASSTVFYLSKIIKNLKGLTIITNSVPTLYEFASSSGLYVIAIGGELRETTADLVGPNTITNLKEFKADKLFLSTLALNFEDGLMDPHWSTADVKKAMISISKERILLVDHTKFGTQATVKFGAISEITKVITDSKTDKSYIKELQNAGIEVIVCSEDMNRPI